MYVFQVFLVTESAYNRETATTGTVVDDSMFKHVLAQWGSQKAELTTAHK